MPVLPILRSDDGRSLPQTFQGAQLTSNEIDGLTLYGGQFRQNSPRNDASMEDMSAFGAASDRFNYAGGEYRFNGNNTMVGVWHARLEDVYQQSFLQLTHSQPVGDWVLGANLGAGWRAGPGQLGLVYEFRESATRQFEDRREVASYYRVDTAAGNPFQVYVLAGLSDGSPDWGTGINYGLRF